MVRSRLEGGEKRKDSGRRERRDVQTVLRKKTAGLEVTAGESY